MGRDDLVRRTAPIGPSFVRDDDRGRFVEIVNEGPWETVIHGSMREGKSMGSHYHRECRAFFFLTSGRAEVRVRHLVDDRVDSITLQSGEGVYFLPFEVHTIHYLEDSDFLLLKSYRYRDDAPDIFPRDVDQP